MWIGSKVQMGWKCPKCGCAILVYVDEIGYELAEDEEGRPYIHMDGHFSYGERLECADCQYKVKNWRREDSPYTDVEYVVVEGRK